MFTGIITDIGRVTRLEQRGDLRATIQTGYDTGSIDIGASIACDGVCLTVIALSRDSFDIEISAETVSKTSVSGWTDGKIRAFAPQSGKVMWVINDAHPMGESRR